MTKLSERVSVLVDDIDIYDSYCVRCEWPECSSSYIDREQLKITIMHAIVEHTAELTAAYEEEVRGWWSTCDAWKEDVEAVQRHVEVLQRQLDLALYKIGEKDVEIANQSATINRLQRRLDAVEKVVDGLRGHYCGSDELCSCGEIIDHYRALKEALRHD